jgi:DNA-binding response OmpR family regulator
MTRTLDGVRILVVEDDADSLELFEYFLTTEGAVVATARSAADAGEWLKSNRPDLLISDLSLPDGDGCALIASVRANPETAHTPAIAVTGHAEDEAHLRTVKAGFDRHIAKPVELGAVLSAILALVSRGGDTPESHSGTLLEDLVGLVARGDLLGLVSFLNDRAEYRFTSLARFEDDSIVRLAHVDREQGNAAVTWGDPPLVDAYCFHTRDVRAPLVVEDARLDLCIPAALRRQRVVSYGGVPLSRTDGTIFGALCHYDIQPRTPRQGVLETLERVARLLRSELQDAAKSA